MESTKRRATMFTKHGQQRANQRGILASDIDLIRRYGAQVADRQCEVIFMTNAAVEQAISDHKQQLQRIEHLRGCKVVIAGDRLVTVHHASRRHEKRLLRRAS